MGGQSKGGPELPEKTGRNSEKVKEKREVMAVVVEEEEK